MMWGISLDFPSEPSPPLQQGASVCSDLLDCPTLSFYPMKVFSLLGKCFLKGFHFLFFSGGWMIWSLPPSFLLGCPWADLLGSVEIYNVGKEQEVWGTTRSPGLGLFWNVFLNPEHVSMVIFQTWATFLEGFFFFSMGVSAHPLKGCFITEKLQGPSVKFQRAHLLWYWISCGNKVPWNQIQ